MRKYIIPLFVVALLAIGYAATLEKHIDGVDVGRNVTSITFEDSAWYSAEFGIEKDSGYAFFWAFRGLAVATLSYQVKAFGVWGDTVRLDSAKARRFASISEFGWVRSTTAISGDSLMNAWRPRRAGESLADYTTMKSLGGFTYRLILKTLANDSVITTGYLTAGRTRG